MGNKKGGVKRMNRRGLEHKGACFAAGHGGLARVKGPSEGRRDGYRGAGASWSTDGPLEGFGGVLRRDP